MLGCVWSFERHQTAVAGIDFDEDFEDTEGLAFVKAEGRVDILAFGWRCPAGTEA